MRETTASSTNAQAYQNRWVIERIVRDYPRGLFAPEVYCLKRIPARLRGSVLDIGIGAGRTSGPLAALFQSYVGIDYSPKLILAAKKTYPRLDLRVMDARKLEFHSEFGCVIFSYNELDNSDFATRKDIILEMYRVLKPGGYLIYSTHNLHHNRVSILMEHFWVAELFERWTQTRYVLHRLRNFPRQISDESNGLALVNDSAFGFRLLTAYVDIPQELRRLEILGLKILATIGDKQQRAIYDRDDCWVYILARKK